MRRTRSGASSRAAPRRRGNSSPGPRRLVDLEQQRWQPGGARAHGRDRGARAHAPPHLAHVDAGGEEAIASRGQVGDAVADAVEPVVALLAAGHGKRAGVLERDAAAAEEEQPEPALGELAVERQPEAGTITPERDGAGRKI